MLLLLDGNIWVVVTASAVVMLREARRVGSCCWYCWYGIVLSCTSMLRCSSDGSSLLAFPAVAVLRDVIWPFAMWRGDFKTRGST